MDISHNIYGSFREDGAFRPDWLKKMSVFVLFPAVFLDRRKIAVIHVCKLPLWHVVIGPIDMGN